MLYHEPGTHELCIQSLCSHFFQSGLRGPLGAPVAQPAVMECSLLQGCVTLDSQRTAGGHKQEQQTVQPRRNVPVSIFC